VPTPGSDAAIRLGCTCPVLDNSHGQGWMGAEQQLFWVNGNCPVHGAVEHAGGMYEVPELGPQADGSVRVMHTTVSGEGSIGRLRTS